MMNEFSFFDEIFALTLENLYVSEWYSSFCEISCLSYLPDDKQRIRYFDPFTVGKHHSSCDNKRTLKELSKLLVST